MASAEDKSALLNQLKIDRTEEGGNPGFSLLQVVLIAAVTAVIVIFLMMFFVPDGPQQTSAEASQSSSDSAESGLNSHQPSDDLADETTKTNFRFSNSDEVLNASGYITARRIATVSAEVMGLLSTVDVEEGMKVKEGQVLATLDSALANVNFQLASAHVEVLQTRIASNESELEEAERVLRRINTLGKDNFSSEAQQSRAQADVDKFRSMLAGAKADIAVARIQVQQQQEILDNHTIRAPFPGVVTVKAAQPGEIVAPSSAGGGFTRTGICTIVDMDSLEIEVDVNEAFIGRVKDGQKVKANPDWDIPASVIAIIPTADRAKATVRVRIQIDNKDERILPDMGVKVAFLRSEDE